MGSPQSTFADGLLRGKNAFIAGGTSGINLGIAKRMTELGARCALLGRDAVKASNAAAEINAETGTIGAIGLSGDVRDYAAVQQAMATAASQVGAFDILIAGQAGNFVALALGMSANAFRAVVDIDLIGSFNVFHAGFAYLRTPGAALIAISAGQAVRPTAMQVHVCAAKAGVNMLVKTLAIEWGPLGVRVNAISPGPIEGTEGMARLAPTPETEASIKAAAPLGRYGRKDEIGDAAIYLCSPAGQYITGAIMDVDGGTGVAGGARVGSP